MICFTCKIQTVEFNCQYQKVMELHHMFNSCADCVQHLRDLWIQRGQQGVPPQMHRLELLFLHAARNLQDILAMPGNDFFVNANKFFPDGYFAYECWAKSNVRLSQIRFPSMILTPGVTGIVIGQHLSAYMSFAKALGRAMDMCPEQFCF